MFNPNPKLLILLTPLGVDDDRHRSADLYELKPLITIITEVVQCLSIIWVAMFSCECCTYKSLSSLARYSQLFML